METVESIREKFKELLKAEEYVIDKTGVKTLEIINANFEVTDSVIFGSLNLDYAERELEWYLSESLSIKDIPGNIPEIWKSVASISGMINSNYGYLARSSGNWCQWLNVVNELKSNPDSRRATMIYNRPSIWYEYKKNGMSDFICCFNSHHFIRNNKLVTIVSFRSSDAIFGFKNDLYWFNWVHSRLSEELGIEPGKIYWQANSLHIYERHFHLIK